MGTQNKLDIKDYLHLYLGAKSHCYRFETAIDYNTIDTQVLHDLYTTYYLDAKPILRRLSDMTEEEKLKLYGMGFTHNVKGLQIEHPKKWPTFKPIQFQYLLSIGIDLFGLIDAELAIDSKALNS